MSTPSPTDRVTLTVKEFCASVGIGNTKFYEEVKKNRIKVLRVGPRKNLIAITERDAYLRRLAGEEV